MIYNQFLTLKEIKKREDIRELYAILSPHDNWGNDSGEEKNLEAKKALYDFYTKIIKLKPETEYRKNFLHMSYLPYLVKIKIAVQEQKYMRACNELISLMYYEHILQGRNYYIIIKIMEEGLELGEVKSIEVSQTKA